MTTTTQKIDRVVTAGNRGWKCPSSWWSWRSCYLAISVGTGVSHRLGNDGISGDGFLYTGGAATKERPWADGRRAGQHQPLPRRCWGRHGIDVEGRDHDASK